MKRWLMAACIANLIFCSLFIHGCTMMPETKRTPQVSDIEGDKSLQSRPLRVAVQSQFCSSMVGLIVDRGWDEQAGIPFNLVVYPDGKYINEGLSRSEWDVAVTGGAFVHAMVEQDALLIAHQVEGTGGNSIYVRKGSSIIKDKGFNPTCPEVLGSPETVKGVTVLQNTGTTSQYILISWLETIGVRVKDINIVEVEFKDMRERFLSGEGDCAAITTSEGIYRAEDAGWTEAASFETMGLRMLESTISTREAYDERYDDLVAFLKLLYKANEELYKDKKLQFEVVKKWYADTGNPISDGAVKKEIENRSFLNLKAASKLDLNDFAMSYAESYVKTGILEPEALSIMRENIMEDILKDAL